ncbi:GNAT family N-acetyltransferase [uncultured Desulfobacter sp.]|uniref:GNAT family N-acetyltransferase n=1 Tax=uncultured Desulfobacter sp. TaxID=240139 RepID=UPI0029F54CE1|nr:GNAT family N-acetyltransferase [uncultured Desulfobacter sp.]
MIREARESDCINIAALSLEVWLTTYSIDGIRTENSKHALSLFTETYFKGLLKDSKYKLLVSTNGVYLRGFALINLESQFEKADNGFEIQKLYVHGPFQSQGIGQTLLSEIIERYGNKFWLYTWIRNKSLGFYKKYGFVDIGQYNFKLGNHIIENCVLAYVHT